MRYQFPATRFAFSNSAEEQAAHVLSEADELRRAIAEGEGTDRIDEEAMDAFQSLETYFRIREIGRGPRYVHDLQARVELKCRLQGYYDTFKVKK